MPEPAANDDPGATRPPAVDATTHAGGAKIHELPSAKAPAPTAERPPRVAPAGEAPALAAAPPARRSRLRGVLLLLGPVVVIAAALGFYLLGGRYVSTDNAYVRADKLNIATQISGAVSDIPVHENQGVKKGDVIFRIDDAPYRIALAAAEAQLGATRNEIMTLQATYRQNIAQIEQAKIDVAFYETAFQRQQDLIKRGVSSQTLFDQAKHDLDAARERVTVAQRSAETVLAQLGGDAASDVGGNPRVRNAQAQVDGARRNLSLATIVAPINGIAANVSSLQIGQYLAAGQPAFSIVGSDDVWVDANPKETDLAGVKPGAKAHVTIDAYPGREWSASVASISPATGAEFSVLPAQNSSGNWIKIVQRVPVRLHVDHVEGAPQLRSGMSANVEIETGERRSLGGLFAALRHLLGL
ncbi:MAG: hypothetical protein BGP06_02965 [Rhizobiales bacterium 65-9]|nr:MAG: hypothetical protein BGP06_02965 [Rhizobiales bacterium 65-9]